MKVFFKKLSKKGGFSLVELMVVVAIIGILAAIAVPKFNQFRAKAVQAEAKNSLGSIHSLQQLYYAENDAFQADITMLSGFAPNPQSKYTYATTGGNAFLATATAKMALCANDNDSDTWTINENATLTNSVKGADGC